LAGLDPISNCAFLPLSLLLLLLLLEDEMRRAGARDAVRSSDHFECRIGIDDAHT
jgi:hypothetical protein